MDSELKEKSLKLLADPHKLKHTHYSRPMCDPFKQQLEYTFKCKCSKTFYNHIIQLLQTEVQVYKILIDIIDQVSLPHNP